MRAKLEIIAAVAFLPVSDLLDVLRELEQAISLDPSIRVNLVEYRYNNNTVARHIGHLYLSAHTHCDPGTVQAIDAALDKYYLEA